MQLSPFAGSILSRSNDANNQVMLRKSVLFIFQIIIVNLESSAILIKRAINYNCSFHPRLRVEVKWKVRKSRKSRYHKSVGNPGRCMFILSKPAALIGQNARYQLAVLRDSANGVDSKDIVGWWNRKQQWTRHISLRDQLGKIKITLKTGWFILSLLLSHRHPFISVILLAIDPIEWE